MNTTGEGCPHRIEGRKAWEGDLCAVERWVERQRVGQGDGDAEELWDGAEGRWAEVVGLTVW